MGSAALDSLFSDGGRHEPFMPANCASNRALFSKGSALVSTLYVGLLYGGATLFAMFAGMPIAFALGAVAIVFMYFFMPAASLDTVTQNVFEEMVYQINKHGITHFAMRNSLTNGNMREFEKLLDLIVEYNQTHEKQISWGGYFIIRNAKQHPERMWQKLSQSNGRLWLGVESVIHNVRCNLGKKFTNEDI